MIQKLFHLLKIDLRRLGVVALGIALVFALMIIYHARGETFVPLSSLGVSSGVGFEPDCNGQWKSLATVDGFHLLMTPVRLNPNTYYRIRFVVKRLPREVVDLKGDLWGPGRDIANLKLHERLSISDFDRTIAFVVRSGNSPDSAYLRVFYSGPPGLEIGNIEISESYGSHFLGPWAVGVACCLLLVFGGILISRYARAKDTVLLTLVNAAKGEMPLLGLLFFVSVLLRFVVYVYTPYWSGDEYQYKSIAAGIWHRGSYGKLSALMFAVPIDFPNRLYTFLIAPAFSAGEYFYILIRLINASVISLTVFPSYLIARKFMSVRMSLLTSAMVMAIPFVNIGAYAVTEVLFFPFFMLCAWATLESLSGPNKVTWMLVVGGTLAVLCNTRMNGVAIVPAFVLCTLWISYTQGDVRKWVTRPHWLIALIAFAVLHVVLQFVTGVREIGALGHYAGTVPQKAEFLHTVINNRRGILDLVLGHVTTLAVPFALPLAVLIFDVIFRRHKGVEGETLYILEVISLTFFSALFLLTLVFTVQVSGSDLGGLGRWHSRYYFYVYPLFIIAFLAVAARFPVGSLGYLWLVALLSILTLAASTAFVYMRRPLDNPWFGSIVDNMDVQWCRYAFEFFWPVIGASLLLIVVWLIGWRRFREAAVLFFLGWLVVANLGTFRVVRPDAFYTERCRADMCGNISAAFLKEHPGRFVIVGDSQKSMVSAAFWIPFVPEKTLIVRRNDTLSLSDIGPNIDYVIVGGDVHIDSTFRPVFTSGKCCIYEQPLQ